MYERALDVDAYNVTVFLKYAELEMKHKNVNMARNVWDRAVTIQPRVDQFWYKYAYMEEALGNLDAAREVYERWMQWQPPEPVWASYIKFERRYRQWPRVRALYERLVAAHHTVGTWLQYARFEEDARQMDRARGVYERAVETLDERHQEPRLFVEFARFEVRMKEFVRARVIYQFALDRFPKSAAEGLYNSYAQFERQYGDDASMSRVVLMKRRALYESQVLENGHNYDAWFDYLRLEEEHGDVDMIRDVYERAIANVPPAPEKRLWRRYIYLWIYYAVFEELTVQDLDRALAVYQAAVAVVPHRIFTFAKLWTLLAQLHIRRGDLNAARRTLGTALGLAAKPKLYTNYIALEMQLREFDRCRLLYEKFLEHDPHNSTTWLRYAELEQLLGDEERVRALYELAIEMQPVDLPELVWKAYIDFECAMGEDERARALYERLLDRTEHLKVWVSYANFEATRATSDALSTARIVLVRAYEALKAQGLVTERILLLEAWKEVELRSASPDSPHVQDVLARFPRLVVKKRKIEEDEWEEYEEYVFPEDEPKQGAAQLLAMAQQWKKTKTTE